MRLRHFWSAGVSCGGDGGFGFAAGVGIGWGTIWRMRGRRVGVYGTVSWRPSFAASVLPPASENGLYCESGASTNSSRSGSASASEAERASSVSVMGDLICSGGEEGSSCIWLLSGCG